MPLSRVVCCLDVIIIRIRVRFGYHIPLIGMMVSEIFQYDKLISSRYNASSEYMVKHKYMNTLLSHLAYSNLNRILIYNIILPLHDLQQYLLVYISCISFFLEELKKKKTRSKENSTRRVPHHSAKSISQTYQTNGNYCHIPDLVRSFYF